MKNLKKILTILLIAVFLLAYMPVSAAESDGVIASGRCGTSDWVINSDGVLTINEGEMEDWGGAAPWSEYSSQITAVETTGTVVLATADRMFCGCENITVVDLSSFDFTKVTDMSYMFGNCNALKSVDFSVINAPNISEIDGIFSFCNMLESVDFSGLDTSKVTNMSCMFYCCASLESLDISGFDTSKVIYMYSMFERCDSLKTLDLSNFDTSNVTDMFLMFFLCGSLEDLNLSSFNTSKVENMGGMFGGCCALKSLDLSNFDTSNVTNMRQMFVSDSVPILDLSSFDTAKVTNMSGMFSGVNSKELIISNFDTSNVQNMREMFSYCSIPDLDLSWLAIPDNADLTDMFNGINKIKSGNWEGTANRPKFYDSMTDTTTMIRYEKGEMFPPVNGHTFVLSRVTTGGYTITNVTLNKPTIEWGEVLEVKVDFIGSEPVWRVNYDFLHTEFRNRDNDASSPTGYSGFFVGQRGVLVENGSFDSETGTGSITLKTTISCFTQIGMFTTFRIHLFGEHSKEDILDHAEILDLYPLEVKAPHRDASFEMYYCDEGLSEALDNLQDGDSAILKCESLDDERVPANRRLENFGGLHYSLVKSEYYNAIKGKDVTLIIPTYSYSYVEINGMDVGDNIEDVYFANYADTCFRYSVNDDGSPNLQIYQSFPSNGVLPSKTVYRFLKSKWTSQIRTGLYDIKDANKEKLLDAFFDESLLYYLINNQSAVQDGKYELDGIWITMTLDHNSDYVLTNADPSKIRTFDASISKSSFVYNGKIQKPSIKLKIIEGHGTKENHKITYSNSKSKAIGSYKVTVKAPKVGHGSYTFKYTIKPPAVKGLKLTSPKSKQLKITWSKASGGVYYNVWYRVKGTTTWKKTTATGTSKLLKKLKAGKTYQVKVRAYKKVSGTTYRGAWTAIKTLKVKK